MAKAKRIKLVDVGDVLGKQERDKLERATDAALKPVLAPIKAAVAPKVDAKAAERQAVLDRLADAIIDASNAHGGEAVFLSTLKCK